MNKVELRYRNALIGILPVVVCLLCVFSCTKEEFPELPSLVMDDPITVLDSIQITARINLKEINGSRITESGFYWARVGDPAMTKSIPMEPIPDNANSADFTGIWTALHLDEDYYFQAYIRVEGSGLIHSEIDTTSTRIILVSTSFSGTGERVNDTEQVRLFGRLSGLRDGVTVDTVGHIWIVKEEALPESEWNNIDINSADSVRSFDPIPPVDGSVDFDDVVWLDPAQYYYVRPFAIYNSVPVYGSTVEIFIGNIWKRVATLPVGRLTNAVSFVIDDRAYIVTGARRLDAATMTLTEFSNGIIVCDPIHESYWLDSDNPFPGRLRIDAVAFTLNSKGYVGSGRASDSTILTDFWSYDPSLSTDRWQSVDSIPLRVFDAVSFVVKSQGRAYVGSGNAGTSNQEPEFMPTATFCSFDGATWDCSLSLNTVPDGLANAVSWNVNGIPFIATGHQENQFVPLLRSVHFFQTESNTFDIYQQQYEGAPRQSAVAFAIDSRVYVGAGTSQDLGIDPTFHDFYVFDFNSSELGWREIDNLGNSFNCGATAFSINGKGYIAGGLEKFALQFPLLSRDIWEYTPSPNN